MSMYLTPKTYQEQQAEKLRTLNSSILHAILSNENNNKDVKIKTEYYYREPTDDLGVTMYSRKHYVRMISAELITDAEARQLIVHCFSDDEVSGADYEQLADYLVEGKYLRQDTFSARRFYEIAINKGQHTAVVKAFHCAVKGQDWDNIYRMYLWACTKGMTESQFLTSSPEVIQAVTLEKRAAEDDMASIQVLADYYKDRKQTDRFRVYTKRLAELGDKDAILFMSELAFSRSCDIKRKAKELHWHEKAADLGCTEALYRIARIRELLAKTDESQLHDAIGFHEQAAKMGIIDSMYRLSKLYGNAESQYYDPKKAKIYLEKAYEFGHHSAMRHEAFFCATNNVCPISEF